VIRNSAFSTNGTGTTDGTSTLGNMTMTENMVLSMLGGWEPGSLPPSSSAYDRTKVGAGPMSHSPLTAARKRYPPYVDFVPGKTLQMGWGPNGAWDRHAVSTLSDNSYESADRIDIPEFVDAFPDQMPFIYLRAIPAAPSYQGGVMTANTQYNKDHLYPYVAPDVSPPNSTNRTSVGSGTSSFPGYSTPGVRDFSNTSGAPISAYFRNPAIGSDTNPSSWEVRQKDGFWLIGAGPDRMYGTKDDQTNFGSF